MKRARKSRSRPHPPREPRPSPIERIETGVATTLALAFFALWAMGSRIQEGVEMAMATATPAAGSGGLGLLLTLAALLALTALFSAVETAVDALRPAHVKVQRERDARQAERLQTLLDQRDRVTAALRVAAWTLGIGIALCTFLLAPGLLDWMGQSFGWSNNHANLLLSAALLLIPVALVHLILSELVAKSYAAVNPIRVAARLHRLALAVSVLFGVPAGGVTTLRRFFVERFGAPTDGTANLAEEEIKSLAEEGHETGEIEVGERALLHSVFEFTDTVAREVMTPRVDMDAVSVKGDPTEVARVIQESGHSRIPLFEDTDDQIVGIIHAKDLFGALLNGKAPNLKNLMRPALFVPENKSLHELLAEMRQNRSQMAIVQDEFGGTAGVVTIEDIVEELVGDIVDEYDVEEPEIVEAPGGWLVDGKTHLDDLNEAARTQLESEEFDTLGGFVFGLFGRPPKLGESIEAEGYRFTIADSDGRRILRVKVERAPEAAHAASSDSEI